MGSSKKPRSVLDPSLLDRLQKAVRVLSSDKDGERAAAVAAIERLLKAVDKDFHDLAEMLAGKIIEVEKVKVVEKIRFVTKIVEVQVDLRCEHWIQATTELLESGDLAAHEHKFVFGMRNKFRLDPDWIPTKRQTDWLNYLLMNAEQRHRRARSSR